MFFKEECIGAQCDNCGVVFETYAGIAVWADKENLHPEDEGWHVDGDVHYCHSCHKIDDNDKVVIVRRIPPVFEVIADFPGNKDFPLGKRIEFHPWSSSSPDLYWEHAVEDCQGKRTWLSHYFELFPHLFKKIF